MNIHVILKYLISPQCILIISLIILAIGRYIFKLQYINCFDIVLKHIGCFKKANGKISFMTLFMYFGVPLLIALALAKIKCIDDASINIITIIISILTSMLFTLLTLTLDMRKRIGSDNNYGNNDAIISRRLLRETYYSVMFGILLSIIILLLCFVNLFSSVFTIGQSFVIYYLTFVVLSNLFMILKRTFKVIDHDMNCSDINKA